MFGQMAGSFCDRYFHVVYGCHHLFYDLKATAFLEGKGCGVFKGGMVRIAQKCHRTGRIQKENFDDIDAIQWLLNWNIKGDNRRSILKT